MARTIAIGDIHGCLDQLNALLAAIGPTSQDHLIFLGDYVDRGPDSAGVLNRVMGLSKELKVSAIMGNHEQMMLDARLDADALLEWVMNGGDATLFSYAGNKATLRDVPTAHWRFLESGLAPYVETETHLFVHANVYPDLAMEEQPDYMLRWERCDESAPHRSGKVIVCGHTPQKSRRPLVRDHLICVDTAAFHDGFLTGVDVGGGKVWQAGKDGRVAVSHVSDWERA
jgi:serine/threonine protein phosphatase 1